MKILILGAKGFIGYNVKTLLEVNNEVFCTSRKPQDLEKTLKADLLKKETISAALDKSNPDVIINCSGVVDNNEQASVNVTFSINLLEAANASGRNYKSIIILGSAAEYGIVDKLPVSENTSLNATSPYGLSKVKETITALELAKKYNLPVVVARIFNPVGSGMPERLLIPQIIKQIQEIKTGLRETVEVSRLDAMRDYLNVKDVALAIKAIVEGQPKSGVYNIGSGKSTSTRELLDIILNNSRLQNMPKIIETSPQPEPLVASQADTTRIQRELGWQPKYSLEQTIKEMMYD